MATLNHSQSRRLYSWWWDSHISPKNSKWLQENLTDMDSKVKAMIKLIEEDADSFARRAEMYYKKRPELMKMVEEFYRAYRALAERYDHATGALRQAHSTMAQAFPNQIPPVLTDESPSGSSGREVEPRTPETPSPIRSFFERGDSDKDAYGTPSRSRVIKRNGAYSEGNNSLSRKGLKQLNDIYLSGEGEEDYANFPEEVRRGLQFEEDLHNEGSSTNKDTQNEINSLQEALAVLSLENQTLKNQKASESERADKAENDAENCKNRLSEVIVEKDDITLEYQKLIERISSMEAEFSRTQDEFKKHNEVTATEVMKLVSTEKRCTLLDKAYQSLQVILEAQEQKMKIVLEENSQLSTDNWNLKTQITSDSERADKAESEVRSAKDSLSKLNFETEAATLQYQRSLEAISYLEGQFAQMQDESMKLREEIVMQATKLNTTEDQCLVLDKEKHSLQLDLENVEQKINIQQEVHNQLSTENEKLKSLVTTTCDRAQKAEVDLQSANSHVLELTFEKEAAIVQYQQSLEMISRLQNQVSQIQNDCIKLNDEMVIGATKLSSVEEQCLLLNKANHSLKTEVIILEQKIRDGEEVFSQLSTVISDLKSQITSESENASKAKTEVQNLRENLNKVNIENESCIRQYQQSLEKISNLEAKISQAEDDFKKLSDDMVLESMKSRHAEEQCCLLEKANQSLKLEVDALEEEKKATEEQVIYQQLELERINASLQDEHQRLLEAQRTLLLMEKSDIQSQKELKQLGLEIQCSVDKLKDAELRNTGLEDQLYNIKDENSALSKQNLSSATQIKVLGDEINTLNQMKQKLEDEQKFLHHNFDHLNEDKKELEKKHQYLTAQLEVVSLNAESLHASLKKMQDEHIPLQEMCKSHEDEKLLLEENLKSMESISVKNTIMESSLADAHVELQELRMKIMALEDSCEALHGEVSTHVTEKFVLISQVETIAQSMEKLMEENAFLEKSSSEVKIEVDGLRRMLIELEDSFQSLCAQKESLVAERCILASQVDSTSHDLESMANRHAELEVSYLNLERENNSRIQEMLELESLLKLEKERQETLVLSSRNQLSTLESQILVVQEENQVLKEQDEVEQQKIMSYQFELLILHSSLSDLNKMISNLSKDCQKHFEASTCAEKLVFKLQEKESVQMERMSSLLAHNEKVKEGMLLLLTVLNKDHGSVDREKDEVLLEIILGEIRNLLNSIVAAQDAVELLQLEMSIIVTLLEQTGVQVKDLGIKTQLLEEEAENRKDEVLVLQCNKQELLERNEQLMQDMRLSCYREEEMKFAMGALQWQLSDLQDAQRASQTEIHEILDENHSLSRGIQSLRERKEALEEENSAAIAEAMTLDHLYLLFRSFSIERAFELKLLSDDAYRLSSVNSKLDWEIRQMNENMSIVELENMHLKESVACMEEYKNCLVVLQFDLHTSNHYCRQLADQIEAGNSSLMEKETELSETNEKVQSVQQKNAELSRTLECVNEDFSKAMMLGEELQSKNFSLSEVITYKEEEIARIGEVNALLYDELQLVSTEVEMIRSREEQLTYRLQKGIEEVDQCEGEIIRLLTDAQYSTISAAILEEKVLELLLESESVGISAMLQTEVLSEEIHSRSAYARELKEKLDDLEGENRELKAHLDAYLPLIMSLQDSIASLGKETLSLADHRASIEKESQDNSMEVHAHHDTVPLVDDLMVPAGVKELKKLTAKLGELQKVITETAALLEKERINHDSDLEAARMQISEMRKSKGIITQIEYDEQHGADLNPHKVDQENTIMKHVQMMKDIQLDQVSSSPYGNVPSRDLTRTGNSETDDQMLELWEAAERACDGRIKRAPQVVLEHDIEAVEDEKSEYPSSELVGEKELSIDRLQLSSEFGQSHQEWSRKATERLASTAQRLSVLQTSMKEMERKMANYEKSKFPKSLTYDAIKEKLKEDEGAVLELIDIHSKLTKKAEDFHASCAGTSGAQEETERKGRMRISIRAQRLSEKTGKLELELQKTQYILLKLEEEHNTEKGKTTVRSSKIILSDYIHERRIAAKQKKRSFCSCIKPKTDGD